MTYWNAVLLGLVQGVAEFLPISSSGHLAVLQNFLAIGDMENHMLFDVLLHLGTLAAVILAFWNDVREVVTEFLRMLHLRRTPRGLKPNRRERRLISFLIIATLPLIPAAFLSNVVESLYQNTFFIGFAFILTGFCSLPPTAWDTATRTSAVRLQQMRLSWVWRRLLRSCRGSRARGPRSAPGCCAALSGALL